MQEMLDRYEAGIFIQKVALQSVQPPDKVQAAFDDAVKAGQDRDRFRNEGQAYANDVVPRARGNAARLLEEANGYLASVVQRAEGDASRFRQILTEYTKAPAVTRERLYIDMMQTVLGSTSKVLVDQKAGSNLLYLPLDKLIQQGGPAAVAPSTTPDLSASRPSTAPAPEASVTLDPSRAREALRNRDRPGETR
jgi:membrane protease subunit HflK